MGSDEYSYELFNRIYELLNKGKKDWNFKDCDWDKFIDDFNGYYDDFEIIDIHYIGGGEVSVSFKPKKVVGD